ARAGADREHHPDRTALLAARTGQREVPLADRRPGPARFLLLRWQDHHRNTLLRIPRARCLSAAGGPARQASFALTVRVSSRAYQTGRRQCRPFLCRLAESLVE